MTRDHLMGYAPAAAEDFNGLASAAWGEPCEAWACVPRETCERLPRRVVGPTCMTRGDKDAVEAERLEARMFHVEQGVMLCASDTACGQGGPDLISGMEAAALSEALLKLQHAEAKAGAWKRLAEATGRQTHTQRMAEAASPQAYEQAYAAMCNMPAIT